MMNITRRKIFGAVALWSGPFAFLGLAAASPKTILAPQKKEHVWHRLDWDDVSTRPTIPGIYAVIVKGDSEREGAHVYYDFADYQTFATLTGEYSKDDDTLELHGDHDEEGEFMLAWCGPLDLPQFDYDWEKLS